MRPPNQTRSELARVQAEMLRRLFLCENCIAGFEKSDLEVASAAVLRKRAWQIVNAWPTLVAGLGSSFYDEFLDFAKAHPFPLIIHPLTDGRLFAAHLARKRKLPDLARIQALSFDLHHQFNGSTLSPRRTPALRITKINAPPSLSVGVFVPWLGVRNLILPIVFRESMRLKAEPIRKKILTLLNWLDTLG